MDDPPTRVLANGEILNYTALANTSVMTLQKNTLYSVGYESRLEERLGSVSTPLFIRPFSHYGLELPCSSLCLHYRSY